MSNKIYTAFFTQKIKITKTYKLQFILKIILLFIIICDHVSFDKNFVVHCIDHLSLWYLYCIQLFSSSIYYFYSEGLIRISNTISIQFLKFYSAFFFFYKYFWFINIIKMIRNWQVQLELYFKRYLIR